MSKKIYFHLGLPKTGTTSIQELSVKFQKTLLENNLLYPSQNLERNRHQYWVKALASNRFAFAKKNLETDMLSGNNVLYSAEGFSNHFYYFSTAAKANFSALISNYDTVGIIFLRKKDSWLRSFYNQCVLNPPRKNTLYATILSFDEFKDLDQVQKLASDQILTDIGRDLGFKKIIPIKFEENWRAQFPELFDCFPEGVLESYRSNMSISEHYIEQIRVINSRELTRKQRNQAIRAVLR